MMMSVKSLVGCIYCFITYFSLCSVPEESNIRRAVVYVTMSANRIFCSGGRSKNPTKMCLIPDKKVLW
jgi:hypothetical protein